MAPNSRIILTRHAQAEHNTSGVRDAPLTPLGKKQAASLSRRLPDLQQQADLVITSPLKRTLQSTYLGWAPAIERLGGLGKVICLPEAQECNGYPCDTGSARETLEADPEFVGFNFELLTPEWASKEGFWATDKAALANRARWVRQYLRDRPEKDIVLVAHGGILGLIAASPDSPRTRTWWNAEVRIYEFDPATVETEDCWLHQKENVAVAGGYGPTGAEIDIELGDGKL